MSILQGQVYITNPKPQNNSIPSRSLYMYEDFFLWKIEHWWRLHMISYFGSENSKFILDLTSENHPFNTVLLNRMSEMRMILVSLQYVNVNFGHDRTNYSICMYVSFHTSSTSIYKRYNDLFTSVVSFQTSSTNFKKNCSHPLCSSTQVAHP